MSFLPEAESFALVAEATGLSRTTLWAGKRELQPQGHLPPEDRPPERIRRVGGGRHPVEQGDPTLCHDLATASCWKRRLSR